VRFKDVLVHFDGGERDSAHLAPGLGIARRFAAGSGTRHILRNMTLPLLMSH
jgi:nucleotide-binding universal stress UspA family protein